MSRRDRAYDLRMKEFHDEGARESDPHRTRRRPSPEGQSLGSAISERERKSQIFQANLSKLWSESNEPAYIKTRNKMAAEWRTIGKSRRLFLERAVALLAEHQSWPMAGPKDMLDWLRHLEESGIDQQKYLDWEQKQHELLAAEKRMFYDISVEKFSECLSRAQWLDGNNESAIVNAYLLYADRFVDPQIYLGRFEDSHLGLRLNGTCLRPPNADFETIESYGVTDVNVNILLDIRYLAANSDNLRRNLSFIPLGE